MTTQRVIEGDCLIEMAKMPNASVDLICTDPPYNLKKDFANDDLSWDDFVKWLTPIFNEMARIIKPKHPVIIFFDRGQKQTAKPKKKPPASKLPPAINVF